MDVVEQSESFYSGKGGVLAREEEPEGHCSRARSAGLASVSPLPKSTVFPAQEQLSFQTMAVPFKAISFKEITLRRSSHRFDGHNSTKKLLEQKKFVF